MHENATSLAGDFFQVMFYDSGAYVWSTTLIQAAWVLVGLAGGWAGVALYRLLTRAFCGQH